MTTDHTPAMPNLTALKLSIPMWTNDEIKLEIKALSAAIDTNAAGKEYYIQKKEILERALRIRDSSMFYK